MRNKPKSITIALAAAMLLVASANAPRAAIPANPTVLDEPQSQREKLINHLWVKLPKLQGQAPNTTAKADVEKAMHRITDYLAGVEDSFVPMWLYKVGDDEWRVFIVISLCLDLGVPYIPPDSPASNVDILTEYSLGPIFCSMPVVEEQLLLELGIANRPLIGFGLLPLGTKQPKPLQTYPAMYWFGNEEQEGGWQYDGGRYYLIDILP